MAEEGEDDGGFPIVNFEAVSEDEATANAGEETDADREARRARNRARAIRRRRANERRQSMYRELDPEFVAVSERGFRTPVANIARVTAILERSHDPNVRQVLLYAQRVWIQLDQQNPASTIREERVGESRSQAHSRTAGGRPRFQPSHNNNNARGSQAPGGRQQPPSGGSPRQANHRPPIEDLRQHINEGRDAQTVISSRRKVREEVETEGTDCSDRFPAFSARFSSYKYYEGFKPIGITKYNSKQAPQQWLRCYSTAIEVAGGSNITKVVYFPMVLDPAPLTWLESLSSNSIDSWERLKKVFIDNFQGVIARVGTRHDLAQCKQERNELLRSYTRRFFDVRATIANISEDNIIDCFYNGITNPGIYRDFGRNRPKTVACLCDMMHDWSEQEEKMRERFPWRQDSNLRRPNDNLNDKGQRDFRVRPGNESQMISSRLSIVLHGARSRQCKRSSRSSCRKGAHGTQVPTTLSLTATTFGGRLATPVVVRRTRSLQTKNPRMTTTTTKGATRSSRMLRRLSTSSSGEMRILAPGGTRSCFSGRSCPLSRRYHDHSVGRRSPSRSPAMTNGQAFRNPESSPWSSILW
jgi:hypothetical protein